jgi:hypothetical protein
MVVKVVEKAVGEVGLVRDAFYDSGRDKDSASSRSCESPLFIHRNSRIISRIKVLAEKLGHIYVVIVISQLH